MVRIEKVFDLFGRSETPQVYVSLPASNRSCIRQTRPKRLLLPKKCRWHEGYFQTNLEAPFSQERTARPTDEWCEQHPCGRAGVRRRE